ncbi:MAG TPA: hypothetical protein VFL47_13260, partial [Flavisolibacter sp.]|nr:hypothetical protein [Flavisolibacter sp.]
MENVDFGTNEVLTPPAFPGLSTTNWPTPVTCGLYRVEYVSGFITWHSDLPPQLCAPFTEYVGSQSGRDDTPGNFCSNISAVLAGGIPAAQTFTGIGCCSCGPINSCDPGTLQANTLALNPVLLTTVDSANYGNTDPSVTWGASLAAITADVNPTGGSIFYRLVQTSHIYPQPACVQIRDFATVKAALGVCPNTAEEGPWCAAFPGNCPGPLTEWNGTFPEKRVFFPNAASNQVGFFAVNIDTIPIGQATFTINGRVLADNFNFLTGIQYKSSGGV